MIISSCYGPWSWLGALEFALIVLVPEEIATILTDSGKGVVLSVERDPIYTVDLRWLILFVNSMTLETKVEFSVDFIGLQVNVLDSTSAFNRADCKALSIAEA